MVFLSFSRTQTHRWSRAVTGHMGLHSAQSLVRPPVQRSLNLQPTNQPISQSGDQNAWLLQWLVCTSVCECVSLYFFSKSELQTTREKGVQPNDLCFFSLLHYLPPSLNFFPISPSLSSPEFVSLTVQCPKCSENPGVKSHLMSLWLRHLSPVLVFPPSLLPPSLLAYEIDARRKNFLIKSAGKPNPPVSVPTTFVLCERAHDFHTFTHTYPDEPSRKNKPLYSSPHHTTPFSPGQQPVTCPWLSPLSLTLPHPILLHPPRCRKERFAAWEADAPGKACLKTACWKNRTRGPQNGAWKLDASSLRARRVLSGDAHPSLITHTGN